MLRLFFVGGHFDVAKEKRGIEVKKVCVILYNSVST